MFAITKRRPPDLLTAANQLGLSIEIVHFCVEAELVEDPPTEADLAELRRVRRLQELEVNMPGIEIILRMRQRMLSLQAELEEIQQEIEAVRGT